MAAQLCSEFGGGWPTDELGMALPPLKRIMYNHAVLRTLKEKEHAHSAGNGSATGQVRRSATMMQVNQNRTIEEYERLAKIAAAGSNSSS